MQSKGPLSRKVAEMLEAKMEGRGKRNFILEFAITASLLLQEARTGQIFKTPRASTALHT